MARNASIRSPEPTPTVRCASPHRVVSAATASATPASSGRVAMYGCANSPASITAGASATMDAPKRALVVADIGLLMCFPTFLHVPDYLQSPVGPAGWLPVDQGGFSHAEPQSHRRCELHLVPPRGSALMRPSRGI